MLSGKQAPSEGTRENATSRRREQIRDIVDEQPFTTVIELSTLFGVSEVTVRSDLRELEARGRLRRVRGGAVPEQMSTATHARDAARSTAGVPARPPSEASPDGLRVVPAKEDGPADEGRRALRMGRCAAALVNTGDLVALDAGPLAAALAAALVERQDLQRLVVITNSIAVAGGMSAAHWATVVVTGGTVNGADGALGAPYVGPAMESLRPDILFTQCAGISAAGVDAADLDSWSVRERWLHDAGRVVVTAPGHAVGRRGLTHMCSLDRVDLVVTDADEASDGVRELGDWGVRVLTV